MTTNQTIQNGDWVTLSPQTSLTHEFKFSSVQKNSTFRWTNALNDDPFWYGATLADETWTIRVEHPVKLIHIESTNANGEIDIVRVGIDWNSVESPQPILTENQTTTDEKKSSSEEQTISPVLLIVISIMAAYIIILQVQKRPVKKSLFEEE